MLSLILMRSKWTLQLKIEICIYSQTQFDRPYRTHGRICKYKNIIIVRVSWAVVPLRFRLIGHRSAPCRIAIFPAVSAKKAAMKESIEWYLITSPLKLNSSQIYPTCWVFSRLCVQCGIACEKLRKFISQVFYCSFQEIFVYTAEELVDMTTTITTAVLLDSHIGGHWYTGQQIPFPVTYMQYILIKYERAK